jgi:hypothetical protein
MALGKEAFADRIFAEGALPRAALGKGFAEGLRGFAECLGPSAKQPAPVVRECRTSRHPWPVCSRLPFLDFDLLIIPMMLARTRPSVPSMRLD